MGVNIWELRPISITSNIATAIKAFFGVHIEPDLNGNFVRIHRSRETNTKIHGDATWATSVINTRNRQSPSYATCW